MANTYRPEDHILIAGQTYVTPTKYAELQKISLRTVWRWIRIGTIKGKRPGGPHGKWWILVE